jgi:hypothetical protein
MLHNALAMGKNRITLIALWDGKPGDGLGGTEHMVETAQARGAKVVILDTRRLFGLRATGQASCAAIVPATDWIQMPSLAA